MKEETIMPQEKEQSKVKIHHLPNFLKLIIEDEKQRLAQQQAVSNAYISGNINAYIKTQFDEGRVVRYNPETGKLEEDV